MNGWIFLGLLLDALITWQSHALSAWLAWVLGAALACSLLGTALLFTPQRRLGAKLVLWSSLPFVPAGFVAAMGARRTLDQLARADFESRRQRAALSAGSSN